MLFITGIGTDVGKTVVSAIVVEALKADYWKPVQSGYPEDSDTRTVEQLITNKTTTFHPESYRLKAAMSPHAAADLEQVNIALDKIIIPETDNLLVAEGAGGLHVPLNHETLYIDLLEKWKPPTLLVSRNYLGSINHTLLSIEALKTRKIPILGLLFLGEETPSTEQIIKKLGNIPIIGRVPMLEFLNKESIKNVASELRPQLLERLKSNS